MNFKTLTFFILILILSLSKSFSQQNYAIIYGAVTDIDSKALNGVNIWIHNSNAGTTSSSTGKYSLKIPSGKKSIIYFSYQKNVKRVIVQALQSGEKKLINVTLAKEYNLETVVIKEYKGKKTKKIPMQKIDVEVLDVLPSATERVITIVKTLPGVSSNTELSSGYTVRGGNYDENLVYINDIEIYRPFLVRSGQQEGLPILNSDLIESINFSAGGFEAKYGDKLSSVLDIKYKTPNEFHAGFSVNLLGASAHVEGSSDNHRFKYLLGARQRSNSYFLNSLDVEGEYNSSFSDLQSYISYDLNENLKVGLFSYYGRNKYNLIPKSQTTDYGTHDLVLRFKVYFDGQEVTKYENVLNAIDLTYENNNSLKLKFIVSAYSTKETEYFDVMGQYWLDQVDTDPGSETFDSTKYNLGVGTFLNHARNRLYADIFNFQHKGEKIFHKSELRWGIKMQYENIQDELREWELLDSSDYIIPINENELKLNRFVSTSVDLKSFRYSGYLQNTFTLNDSNRSYLTAGVRANYWDYNNEFIVTPRFQFVFEPWNRENLRTLYNNPEDTTYKRKLQIKLSAGMYYQPAFYRELRNRQGVLNPEIRAQKSYHFVLGSDLYFQMWSRTFKWTTEAYFKYLDDIIPYDIEDVRIKYFAENCATGYATGVDLQLHGQFVNGLPSWANISIMQTKEDIEDDFTYVYDEEGNRKTDAEGKYITEEQGLIPRPTDQRFRAAIFFQDFLPNNPTSKVNLNFIFATPLPFGPPQFEHLRNKGRMRAYKRVDVGFSKLLVSRKENFGNSNEFFKNFESIWLSGEIFNMFGVRNVISYFWVKDVNNNYWGVPNYLTARRFNVSLIVKF